LNNWHDASDVAKAAGVINYDALLADWLRQSFATEADEMKYFLALHFDADDKFWS
jgi:hypothetical protein